MDGPKQLQQMPLTGSAADTTNNRMELTAAIEAIKAVKSANPIFIRSDSQYLIKGITTWVAGWKTKGWRTADKKPVLNQDLWERLDAL